MEEDKTLIINNISLSNYNDDIADHSLEEFIGACTEYYNKISSKSLFDRKFRPIKKEFYNKTNQLLSVSDVYYDMTNMALEQFTNVDSIDAFSDEFRVYLCKKYLDMIANCTNTIIDIKNGLEYDGILEIYIDDKVNERFKNDALTNKCLKSIKSLIYTLICADNSDFLSKEMVDKAIDLVYKEYKKIREEVKNEFSSFEERQ